MACCPCFPLTNPPQLPSPLCGPALPLCPRPPPCNLRPQLTNLAPEPSLTAVTAAQLHLSHLALLTSFPPPPSGFRLAVPDSSLPPATSADFSSSSPSCASSASFCRATPAPPGHRCSVSFPPSFAALCSPGFLRAFLAPFLSPHLQASVNPASYTLSGKGKREAAYQFRGKGGAAALWRSRAACFSVGLWFAAVRPCCGRSPAAPFSPCHLPATGRSCARDRSPNVHVPMAGQQLPIEPFAPPPTRLPRTTCDHRESTADDTPPAAAETPLGSTCHSSFGSERSNRSGAGPCTPSCTSPCCSRMPSIVRTGADIPCSCSQRHV